MDLRINSDYSPVHNKFTFITETKCLLRGTNWTFKYNLLFIGLKGLKQIVLLVSFKRIKLLKNKSSTKWSLLKLLDSNAGYVVGWLPSRYLLEEMYALQYARLKELCFETNFIFYAETFILL
jgi:hypothetical protein